MSLGENIIRHRKIRGMSQTDLADELNVSRQSVSKWESEASVPELEKLLAMSELFGISLDELVKGTAPLSEELRAAEQGTLYSLVLTDRIFDKEGVERLLREEFGYEPADAQRAVAEAPVVIKRGMRYRDADRCEQEIRELAWLKIMNDKDAWDPVKVKEGINSVPPPQELPKEEESESWSFGGTIVAVVLGVIIAVLILSWF